MIDALEDRVRAHWRELSPAPEPRALHFLKFNWSDFPDPETPLVFLGFADGSDRPVAVVKAARIESGDALVEREYAQLGAAHAAFPEALRHVIPVPLHLWRVNGRACLLSTAVPGTTELVNTWGPRAAARRARAIAAALQWSRAVSMRTAREPMRLCAWLDVPDARTILNILSERGWSDETLRALEPRVFEASEIEWPAAFVHGDFFAGNLLYEGDALSGVVDWGGSFERAPIFVDPLTYELSFALHALFDGREPSAEERAAAHALAPIADCRRALQEAGVDVSLGSHARLAVLLAGTLAHGPAWRTRHAASLRYERLLRLEWGMDRT